MDIFRSRNGEVVFAMQLGNDWLRIVFENDRFEDWMIQMLRVLDGQEFHYTDRYRDPLSMTQQCGCVRVTVRMANTVGSTEVSICSFQSLIQYMCEIVADETVCMRLRADPDEINRKI